MRIRYVVTQKISQFKIMEWETETTVQGLAFTQGDLHYFRKNQFEYLVLSKGKDGRWYK